MDKTVVIAGCFRESLAEGCRTVVIAHHEIHRPTELFDVLHKPGLGRSVAQVVHVTVPDGKDGTAVFCSDRSDCGLRSRVLPVEQPAANDMGVREIDEFHSAASGLAQSSQEVPELNTGPSQVKGMSWMMVPVSLTRITA